MGRTSQGDAVKSETAIVVRHGVRETVFTAEGGALRPVRIVDKYPSGETIFEPPALWASPEAWAEAGRKLANDR